MERIVALFIVAVSVAICAACTVTPGEAGDRAGKVADQHLAAYAPIRRLIYRAVCGSDGPLTICVDRISMSDTTMVVEARVKNTSPQSYLPRNTKESAVLLVDDAGMTLKWDNAENIEFQGGGERAVHFRMAGHFSGEPTILVVNNISAKSPEHAGRGLSIAVRLGK